MNRNNMILYMIISISTCINAFYITSHTLFASANILYSSGTHLKSPVSTISSLPPLPLIKREASKTIKNSISKVYCKKTGGYPNINVKYSIYLNVWASLKHSNDIREQQKLKNTNDKCYQKDELETFGLI